MTQKTIKIFLIAGEASGDILGAGLMRSLRQQSAVPIEFSGIGGDAMLAQGLKPLFPMSELSLMGFFEIIPHIPALIRRMDETVRAIQNFQPDAVVTIDSPGFNKRIAKKLGRGKYPLIHYVAPSVWAWRPGRAKKMAQLFDHVLCLLPFEPSFFTRQGMKATFVGHPVVESDLDKGDGVYFRNQYGLDSQTPVLCLLPGSRVGEIQRLLPLFLECYGRMRNQIVGLRAVLPTLPHLRPLVQKIIGDHDGVLIADNSSVKKHAFAASFAALAASGTVSIELAKAKLPCVIAYRVNPLTAMIARLLVKTKYFTLTNIVLDEPAVPEFFQDQATANHLTGALMDLYQNPKSRETQIQAGQRVLGQLSPGGQNPSDMAAKTVLAVCKKVSS